MQQINQNLNSQTTPYISSSRASYRSVEKTDCVITAPRCSMFITKVRPESTPPKYAPKYARSTPLSTPRKYAPYISSSRASYRSVEKTDCVITAPRCSMFITKVRPESTPPKYAPKYARSTPLSTPRKYAPYISSSRASYRSVEKTDCVITAPRRSMFITKVRPESPHLVLPYLHAVPPNASLRRNERKGGASRALHGANQLTVDWNTSQLIFYQHVLYSFGTIAQV